MTKDINIDKATAFVILSVGEESKQKKKVYIAVFVLKSC